MTGLLVTETGAPAEAVVGVCGAIAFEDSNKAALLLESEGTSRTYPDLEVSRRGFNDHAAGLPGFVGMLMMSAEDISGYIIKEEEVLRLYWLHEDMAACGVLALEIGDVFYIGFYEPSSLERIKNCKTPPEVKEALEFSEDGFHL